MNPCNFIDPTAHIGTGTRVWHYAVILRDVVISNNCVIGSGTEIGRGSYIGEGTHISSNCFLPARSKIGASTFIGPNVTFTDDRFPIAGNTDYHAEPPLVGEHVSIGAGSVILPGVHIGAYSIVGAGSIVTRSIPPRSKIYGPRATLRTTQPAMVESET